MSIYFVRIGRKAVRIGYSARPHQRCDDHRRSTLEQVEVVSIIEGDRPAERELHRKFKNYRIRGEFFEVAGDLKDYLDTLPPAPPKPPPKPRKSEKRGFPIKDKEKLREYARLGGLAKGKNAQKGRMKKTEARLYWHDPSLTVEQALQIIGWSRAAAYDKVHGLGERRVRTGRKTKET